MYKKSVFEPLICLLQDKAQNHRHCDVYPDLVTYTTLLQVNPFCISIWLSWTSNNSTSFWCL